MSAFFLITGTSRGVGEALAQKALSQGDTVFGVARTRSESITASNYHHLPFDLTHTSELDWLIREVEPVVHARAFDFVCLVNNASAIQPLGHIENCAAAEIEAHVRIGVISPMILTSLFIARFAALAARKKVALISSGSAAHPVPDGSIYCSSKAALNMFAQCVGLEQAARQHGFEIVAISPGMVDTSMQVATRSMDPAEFSAVRHFRDAFEQGRLQPPERAAGKLYELLMTRSEQGQFVSLG